MAYKKETRPYRQVTERAAKMQANSITYYAVGAFLALSITGILPAIVCGLFGVGM